MPRTAGAVTRLFTSSRARPSSSCSTPAALLVILACNTASARALRTLQQRHLPARRPDRRILGVVRPAAEALAGLPPDALPGTTVPAASGVAAVLGTAGTIASDSYRLELAKLAPGLVLIQQACPLWVALVEAGELDGPGTEFFLRKYLDPVLAAAPLPERILLACTHYPLLRPAIRRVVDQRPGGAAIRILDQGRLVADRLVTWMARHPEVAARLGRGGVRRYLATDDPGWFGARAEALLGAPSRPRPSASPRWNDRAGRGDETARSRLPDFPHLP